MPRIPFQKPKKVEWEELGERYGRLVAEPFEKGYALTVGNALRRTLLSIISGAAVSWVKIDGVRTIEAHIPGVSESTADVLLNLKKLAIQVPSDEPRVLRLEVRGPKAVTGADLPEIDVEIMNPELPLFTIEGPPPYRWSWGWVWAADTRRPIASPAPSRRGLWPSTPPTLPSLASPTTSRCRGRARSPTTRSWWSRCGPTAR